MKKIFLLCILFPYIIVAQVGINTTNPNASLDIRSSNQVTPNNTDGILIPKIDTFPAINPVANQDGMLVYLTTAVTFASINYTEGFHYWDWNTISGTGRWVSLTSIERINDLLDGKSDVDGSEDGSSVYLGINAGANDDSSDNKNVAIGYFALQDIDGSTTNQGDNNVAIGYHSLRENTTGRRNTSIGHLALAQNITGNNNTAIGGQALSDNTYGSSNIAIGAFTLTNNTVGVNNVSTGNQSMRYNETGEGNTAYGDYALKGDLDDLTPPVGTGNFNTAYGSQALEALATGNNNVAIGYQAGNSIVSNNGSIFLGYQAGLNETDGNRLYIENTDADPDNALIYGEFGTNNTTTGNILRTNSEFQIGNPATTGYALPTTDGTANQILVTDGSGAATWENQPTSISSFSIARTTLSANQTLTVANTWTKVSFNSIDFDLNSDFDSTNNVFDVPANGIYCITAMYTSDVTLTDNRTYGIRITRNISGGGTSNLQEVNYKHMNENSRVVRQVTTLAQLTNGDNITIQARVNVASGLTIDQTSRFTSFSIERVR